MANGQRLQNQNLMPANAQVHQRQASLGSNGQKQMSSQIRMKENTLYDKRGRNSKGQLMFNYLGHNTEFKEG